MGRGGDRRPLCVSRPSLRTSPQKDVFDDDKDAARGEEVNIPDGSSKKMEEKICLF